MKMEGLNLQNTVSLDRDSSQRYSELTEYSGLDYRTEYPVSPL